MLLLSSKESKSSIINFKVKQIKRVALQEEEAVPLLN
jgi:hypothetical protein